MQTHVLLLIFTKTCILSSRFHISASLQKIVIAFVKERIHVVEIDILGIFGRVFIVTNLAPRKNIQGCGLAFILSASLPRITHLETENSFIAYRLKRKRSPNAG